MTENDQQEPEKSVSSVAKFAGYASAIFGCIVGLNFVIPALSAAGIYIIAKKISPKNEDAYRLVLSLNVGYACWFFFGFFAGAHNADLLAEGCSLSILSIVFYLLAYYWVAYILIVCQLFGLCVNIIAVVNLIDSTVALKALAVHIVFRVSCLVFLVLALLRSRQM